MSYARWSPLLLALAACGSKVVDPVQPSLAVSPEAIDFGEVVVLYDKDLSVQLLNEGRAPLDITRISLNGEESDVYTLSLLADHGSLDIEPEEALDLSIRFEPATYAVYESVLVIESNDPENSELRVPVRGEGGDGPVPNIEVSPLSIDFGDVMVGAEVTTMLSVANTGDSDLYIGTTTQYGSGAFSLGDPELYTIGAGQKTVVPVRYAPVDELGDSGSFVIESNDPDESKVEVFLLGNGGGD